MNKEQLVSKVNKDLEVKKEIKEFKDLRDQEDQLVISMVKVHMKFINQNHIILHYY